MKAPALRIRDLQIEGLKVVGLVVASLLVGAAAGLFGALLRPRRQVSRGGYRPMVDAPGR